VRAGRGAAICGWGARALPGLGGAVALRRSSRFITGGGHKLLIGSNANHFIRLMFGAPLIDFTNAFKA